MMENQFSHEHFIRRCLQISENGWSASMPNPCVGAVLVHDGRIIGEGFTSEYGGAHGEVNAIRSVKKEDQSLIPSSTLYVTLEPCSHHGKTPPCTDLIIQCQIPEVVIGTLDPNPLVGGQGVKKLQQAGIKVTIGVLKEECRWSLRKFLITHQYKRPFITLKWAETKDGFIAHEDGKAMKITSNATQILTHQCRAEHQGILVGWKTIANDQPKLDVRHAQGRSPQVIILDFNQNLNDDAYFLSKDSWWRIVKGAPLRNHDISVEQDDLKNILEVIFQKGIQSIYVEGGAYTHQQFIDQNLWDECYRYIGNMTSEKGISAPLLHKAVLKRQSAMGHDDIQLFVPVKK